VRFFQEPEILRRTQTESDSFVNLKLSLHELDVLTSLASDQLFRREFIDPKMPGHRADSGRLAMGKALLARMQDLASPAKGSRMPSNHRHAL
jgi:hypothetical protein